MAASMRDPEGRNQAPAAELREMSDEQLQLTLKDASESLFRLRIQAQTERLDAPTQLRNYRRLIARIKTIQTQRSRESSPGQATASATETKETKSAD